MAYKLMWFDEFDQDGPPDAQKWRPVIGGHGFGNNEAQFYTDFKHNVRVENGQLVIQAHREIYGEHHYTSARLTTYELKSFQYGKLLVRAKLPKGQGTWPAIWLLPNSIRKGVEWPRCGEIDLVEHVGRDQDMLHFSLHTGLYNHRNDNHYTFFKRFEGITDDFNEYGLEWTPEYIAYLLNGEEVTRFVRGEKGRDVEELGWPFDQKFHLVMNLAIGGNWGGAIDDRCLPAQLVVDYVRYYELVENM